MTYLLAVSWSSSIDGMSPEGTMIRSGYPLEYICRQVVTELERVMHEVGGMNGVVKLTPPSSGLWHLFAWRFGDRASGSYWGPRYLSLTSSHCSHSLRSLLSLRKCHNPSRPLLLQVLPPLSVCIPPCHIHTKIIPTKTSPLTLEQRPQCTTPTIPSRMTG